MQWDCTFLMLHCLAVVSEARLPILAYPRPLPHARANGKLDSAKRAGCPRARNNITHANSRMRESRNSKPLQLLSWSAKADHPRLLLHATSAASRGWFAFANHDNELGELLSFRAFAPSRAHQIPPRTWDAPVSRPPTTPTSLAIPRQPRQATPNNKPGERHGTLGSDRRRRRHRRLGTR